jgi:dTDP-glucose 4,6-dehydratase
MRTLTSILIVGDETTGVDFTRWLLREQPLFRGSVIRICYARRSDIANNSCGGRYSFESGDICSGDFLSGVFEKYRIDTVIQFASTDSGEDAERCIKNNITGTYTLLEIARRYWSDADDNVRQDVLFHHITGMTQITPRQEPNTPCSAALLSGEQMAMSFFYRYALPIIISNRPENNLEFWDMLNNGTAGAKYNSH